MYYLVTFLAACVILGFAGWQAYLHRQPIMNYFNNQFQNVKQLKNAKAETPGNCTCVNCECCQCDNCTCDNCECCQCGV